MAKQIVFSRQKAAWLLNKLAVSISFAAFMLTAAPHVDESFEFLQPDGSKVSVVVNGDEFYQRVESVDGYTLVRNSENGSLCQCFRERLDCVED
jgi:hypothetical protein